MRKILQNNRGQALVTMVFIAVIGITIITAAAIFIFQNIKGASIVEQGSVSYYIAEAGVQEALLRLLRNPSYSGTTPGNPLILTVGSYTGSVDIVVSTPSGIITSTGKFNDSIRKIRVQTMYNNGVLNVSSWKEIP